MKLKLFLLFFIAFFITGCGPSFEKVQPGYSTKPLKPITIKETKVEQTKRTNLAFSRTNGVITEMKIITEADGSKLFVVQGANKLLTFSDDSASHVNRLDMTTAVAKYILPVVINHKKLSKAVIPDIGLLSIKSYRVGADTIDLKDNGHFVYISGKKEARVLKGTTLETMRAIVGNGWKKSRNIKTIRTKSDVLKTVFQPNSNRLLISNSKNNVEIWDYTKKKRIKTITKHKSEILSVKFSETGKYLATADKQYMYVWDTKTFKQVAKFTQKTTSAIAFSNDETNIAVTGDFSDVMIYNIQSSKLVKSFNHGYGDIVYGLSYDKTDKNTIVTAGQDGGVKTWSIQGTNNKNIHTLYNTYDNKRHCDAQSLQDYFALSRDLSSFSKKYSPSMTECNFLGDKTQVINYANKNILTPYMVALGNALLLKHPKYVEKQLADIDSQILDLVNHKRNIDFADKLDTIIPTWTPLYDRDEHVDFRAQLLYKNNSELQKAFMDLQEDRNYVIKKMEDSTLAIIAQMNSGSVYGLVRDGDSYITYGTGMRGRVLYVNDINEPYFSYQTSNDFRTYKNTHVQAFSTGNGRYDEVIAKDEQTIIAAKDNQVEIWNYDLNKLEDVIQENGRIYSLAYDANQNILALGSSNHTIKLWDLTNKRLLATLKGHTGNIISLAFAKQGTTLISAGADAQAIIWDVKTNKILKKIAGFERAASRITIHPNQKEFIILSVGQNNSSLFIYSMDTYEILKKISPEIGTINGCQYFDNGKKLLLASSGRVFKSDGGILLKLDTTTYKTLGSNIYKPPFNYTRGISINEAQNTVTVAGNSRYLQELTLNTLTPIKTLDNGRGNLAWNSIDAVGSTQDHKIIVGNRAGFLTIHH